MEFVNGTQSHVSSPTEFLPSHRLVKLSTLQFVEQCCGRGAGQRGSCWPLEKKTIVPYLLQSHGLGPKLHSLDAPGPLSDQAGPLIGLLVQFRVRAIQFRIGSKCGTCHVRLRGPVPGHDVSPAERLWKGPKPRVQIPPSTFQVLKKTGPKSARFALVWRAHRLL
jgi:hypothetical protein